MTPTLECPSSWLSLFLLVAQPAHLLLPSCLVHPLCLYLCKAKRFLNHLTGSPPPPHIFAIRLLLHLGLFLPVSLLYRVGSTLPRCTLQRHAEAPVRPMLAARAQVAVTVDVVEVATERGAVKGSVKGGAAGHCGGEGGVMLGGSCRCGCGCRGEMGEGFVEGCFV